MAWAWAAAPKTRFGDCPYKPGAHPVAKAAVDMMTENSDCRSIRFRRNLEVLVKVFMVVGDCLRVDKNDTALGGSIFLNHVAAKKFLPTSVTIFNSSRRICAVARTIDFLANSIIRSILTSHQKLR